MITMPCGAGIKADHTHRKPAAAIVLGFLLVLAGCELLPSPYGLGGTLSDPSDADAVFADSTVSDNVHRRRLAVEAPLVGSGRDTYNLIAAIAYDENRRPQRQTYVLAVHVSADDWLFLEHVYAYGQPFPVVDTQRELVDCYTDGTCLITENVLIGLTGAELDRFAQTGFAFEVTGSGGSREFFVPANYFVGFLRRVRLILGEQRQNPNTMPPPASRSSVGDSAALPDPTTSQSARRPAPEAPRRPQRP